jgi:ABC-type oligopeptide transport system ATPase subunit
VPILIGLMGPSGSGKTFSALRLATGIQQVSGGDIFFIDTESRRALHYADRFKFRHIPFEPPFGSLDYLEAIQFAVGKGGGVVIVDSMSHEHEGPGGMMDYWEEETERLSGGDAAKRERVKMLAIQKPKQARRKLITGLLQLNANFIFCFRAKDTAKPMKNDKGRLEIVNLGYMPIAGEEFVFEMTVNCLLLPGAKGVPSQTSENIGERAMMKVPEQFTKLFGGAPRSLDEALGKDLAEWARGVPIGPPVETLIEYGNSAAKDGTVIMRMFWEGLSVKDRHSVGGIAQLEKWKAAAAKADEAGKTIEAAVDETAEVITLDPSQEATNVKPVRDATAQALFDIGKIEARKGSRALSTWMNGLAEPDWGLVEPLKQDLEAIADGADNT